MWWHRETIYQIYPRSLQDANGDGVGDLEGIRSRLPYLQDLGVDAIWLSPIFTSPMNDFGYDVADYREIDPLFGSMADFDALLAEAHERGLRLLLDFVPNHTSDQHQWFLESRSSRENPKRDWYIWKDPAPDGGPPNNWQSNFGGSAWQWDEATGQYYYHAFLKAQPDLNWRNPDVRAAMYDVLRFWFGKGVDGFRIDVLWHLIKDERFRDNPPNPSYEPGQPDINKYLQVHSTDQPEIHEVIREMRAVAEEYDDRLLIGEIYLPLERLMDYYGQEGSGIHLPFNFQLIQCEWRAERIASMVREYEERLPDWGWPNWVLSNHDQPRIAARAGEAQAAVAAFLLLTLRGTPTIYYGDELGLGNVEIPPDRVQDCWAKEEPDASFNRDQARTPMQWSDAENAGFSEAEPWLPLSSDWQTRNVEARMGDEASLLSLYKRLLALRRAEPALQTGAYRELYADEPIFAFERIGENARLAALLNFSGNEAQAEVPKDCEGGEIILSTERNRRGPASRTLTLAPNEALLIRAKPSR